MVCKSDINYGWAGVDTTQGGTDFVAGIIKFVACHRSFPPSIAFTVSNVVKESFSLRPFASRKLGPPTFLQ